MRLGWCSALALCLGMLAGCSSDPECSAGKAGCECRTDQTCEGALACLSGICVGDEGDSAASPGGSGGTGGSSGMDSGPTPGGRGGSQPPSTDDAGPDGAAGTDGGDAATDSECPALDAPAQGSVSVPARTPGEVAMYGCEMGFGLVGVASRTCQSNGSWSGEAPSCAPGDCPNLMSPEHGTVTTANGTAVGEMAVFACESGHRLVGDAMRACQQDSSWSGADPTCVPVDCGALTAPDQGAVDTTAGTAFGATATYSCSDGHQLSSSATRSCQADATWSGSAPLCEPRDCGALSPPMDGSVDTTAGTRFGAVASYGCKTGFGLVGVQSRSCQADGSWSGSAPSCAIGDCQPLPSPMDGSVSTPTGTTYGSVASYSCKPGYTRVGAMTRTCQNDRTWSGAAPVCQIVTCPTLTAPGQGSVSAGNTYNTTVTYGCQLGHYLSGNRTRTCQATGSWTGSDPSCPDGNTEGLRLQQLHVGGTTEFVVIKNTGASTTTLTGLHLEVRDVGATYSLDFTGGTITSGSSDTVGEGTVDHALELNLAGARAAAVLLCGANPCSASNVLDAFTYEGDGVAPALPSGVAINAPVYGINGVNDDKEDFYRVAYDGTAPSFSSCDWAAAPKPPIFVESFECGDDRWLTYGGTWAFHTSGSGDGSPTALAITGSSTQADLGKVIVFPQAVFPTHIEFWMYGLHRMFFCSSPDTCSSTTIGGAGYWNFSPPNACWIGQYVNCRQFTTAQWMHVKLDNIDWSSGTLGATVNDMNVTSDAQQPIRFPSSWVSGTGMRRLTITGVEGAIIDGIRLW